jgi:hypothetical protein
MSQMEEENNNHGDGGGLFGEDDYDELGQQQQHYDDDDGGVDDILGLDDDDENAGDVMPDSEGSLLMRFCPHDSSMLYPKVSSEIYAQYLPTDVMLCSKVYIMFHFFSQQ